MLMVRILAVFIALGHFVTPYPRPDSYRLVSITGANPTPSMRTAYRQPGVVLVVPKASGQRDSLFAVVSETPVDGGTVFRFLPIYHDSIGEPSNVVILNVVPDDSLWTDLAHETRWADANPRKASVRQVVFIRRPDDSQVFGLSPCLPGLGPVVKFSTVNAAGHECCEGDSVRCVP